MVDVIKNWRDKSYRRSEIAPVVLEPENVEQWREKLIKQDDESAMINAMAEPELMVYLESKLKQTLQDDGEATEEVYNIARLCCGKLLSILETYHLPAERLGIMRQVCKIPGPEVLKSLRNLPVEILEKQLRTFLVIPA